MVPAGVVCFFPSFQFLDTIVARWNSTNALARIRQCKPVRNVYRNSLCLTVRVQVFSEPREAVAVEKVLKDYEAAVSRTGAVLLSVMGGKLSEGINFGDDLGRGVFVVGLPYPNRHSAELSEKLLHIERISGKSAADAYYTNLCMKSVNQSIGTSNNFSLVALLTCESKAV